MAGKPKEATARERFAAALAGHLAKGTRPRSEAGEPWTYAEFAREVQSSRQNEFVSERSVSNWCKGKSLPQEIEPIVRALFGPSERHGAARGRLRRLFREARAEKSAAIVARAKPDPAGARWIVEGDQFVLDRTSRPTDKRAAADPIRQQLQVAIRGYAEKLAEQARRLENAPVWSDISATAQAFHDIVALAPQSVPDRLGEAYALLLRLGRFLETDLRLRQDPSQSDRPLDADIHGSLTDLVRTAAPWLRGFPTVAAMDDQAGKALVRASLFEPALAFLQVAHKQEAISGRDAAELETLGRTADSEDFQGRKAGARAVGSAKNLLFATASSVASGLLPAAATEATPTRRLGHRAMATLASAEVPIEAIAATLSDDMRYALRALVDEGKQGLGLPGPDASERDESIPDDVEQQARALILEGREPPGAWRPFIRKLDLSFSDLENLAPLAGLTALQRLDLTNTQVGDLAPLAGLTALQTLKLRNTQVGDLAPLAGLTALQSLDLEGTPVGDLAPLAGLTALQGLNLMNTQVGDLAPLAHLTELHILIEDRERRPSGQRARKSRSRKRKRSKS